MLNKAFKKILSGAANKGMKIGLREKECWVAARQASLESTESTEDYSR